MAAHLHEGAIVGRGPTEPPALSPRPEECTLPNAYAYCYIGLNIGTGHNMAPDIYWAGLIDDVRIYNRAIRP